MGAKKKKARSTTGFRNVHFRMSPKMGTALGKFLRADKLERPASQVIREALHEYLKKRDAI